MTDTVREALEQARALITTYLPQLKDGDTYIKIEAALATASDGWRDIESAPHAKDDKHVWVRGGRYPKPTLVPADGEWWNSSACPSSARPTHWAPCEPPAQDQSS